MVNNFTMAWQRLEKGIMAGCTVSVILFVAVINMLLKVGVSQCRGPKAKDGTRHTSCRDFMGDVTVMTESSAGTRWILIALETMENWTSMKIKPTKSRSLTITEGKLGLHIFIIQGEKNSHHPG